MGGGAAFGFFAFRTDVLAFAAGWGLGLGATGTTSDLVTLQDGGIGFAARRGAAAVSDARQ